MTDSTKLKRGYALEVIPGNALEESNDQSEKMDTVASSRSTRTSRGEYGLEWKVQKSNPLMDSSNIKVCVFIQRK